MALDRKKERSRSAGIKEGSGNKDDFTGPQQKPILTYDLIQLENETVPMKMVCFAKSAKVFPQ